MAEKHSCGAGVMKAKYKYDNMYTHGRKCIGAERTYFLEVHIHYSSCSTTVASDIPVLFCGWGTAADMENVRFRAATRLAGPGDVTLHSDCDGPKGRPDLCGVDAWILGTDSLRFKVEMSTTRPSDSASKAVEMCPPAPGGSLGHSTGSSIPIQKSSS